MIETIGAVAAIAVAAWFLGGVVLRAAGLIVLISGIISLAAYGDDAGFFAAGAGVVMWLVGHWHFALRYRYWKSALAQRIVIAVPLARDPAEGWGVPSVSTAPHDRA